MTTVSAALSNARIALRDHDFAEAEALLRDINANPGQRSTISMWMYGSALEAIGKADEAIAAFEETERLSTLPDEKATILNKIAAILRARGSLTRADMLRIADCLERSVGLNPGVRNVVARATMCATCYALQDYPTLIRHAAALARIPGQRVTANLYLARAHLFLGRRQEGLTALSTIGKRLASLNDSATFGYLELLLAYKQYEEAEAGVAQIVSERGDCGWLKELRARTHVAARRWEDALSILTESFVKTATDNRQSAALHEMRAKSLHCIGDFKNAHHEFVRMNEMARQGQVDRYSNDVVERYTRVNLDRLPTHLSSESAPYTPVFMVGFPRSGTTLLETIIDTHDHIETLGEVGGIDAVRFAASKFAREIPEELELLTESEIAAFRIVYFRHNEPFLKREPTIVVDKLPLNILHIPLIVSLFPEARFILSLRNPIDVCVSCFQQNFAINSEMIFFTDLESCFKRYGAVMELFENYRRSLDLDIIAVRYEDLVDDIATTGEAVFNFLGVKPSNNYIDYHLGNRDRLVHTPSSTQVSQPLYRSSMNRWTNYEQFVQPYVPRVRGFLERYGYA